MAVRSSASTHDDRADRTVEHASAGRSALQRGPTLVGEAVVGESQPRPGFVPLASGVYVLVQAAAVLATGQDLGPGRRWLAVAYGAAGAGLATWGTARLRRARAARPDLSWWAFLRGELIAVGVATVAIPAWLALSQERRDWLMRVARDLFELVQVARGHP
jgi:hypothetical protein